MSANWLRIWALAPPLTAFVWFAGKDLRLHLRARRVPLAENVIHLLLGPAQFELVRGAFLGQRRDLLVGALATAVLGALDEYVFHRGISSEESDVHAKAHWAMFSLLALALTFEELAHAH
jgi:hypothetical protein